MAVVVNLIIALLPVLLDWLIALLNERAAQMDATGDDAADAEALLAAALEDRGLRFHPVRRAVVAFLLATAPAAIRAGTKLSPADADILTALAARCS